MIMNALNSIRQAWQIALHDTLDQPVFRRMLTGELSAEEYAAILRQIAIQVARHPDAMARLAENWTDDRRSTTKALLGHAKSESGHDELARRDIRALALPSESLPSDRELPATRTILAYMESLLDSGSPVAFLGYVFHLEFLPTAVGAALLRGLELAGIPRSAMTFIAEHREVDVAHNRLMERYLTELVRTDEELKEVIDAAVETARLYAEMLEEAAHTALRFAEPMSA